MTPDLDSLATALYAKTDDLLKESPHLALWRPEIGIEPKLSDAEPVALAVMQALLGYVSERRWIRYASSHLQHLFPYLPGQSGYNRRLRKAADLIARVNRLLATDTSLWTDDVWVVDSTPIECGRSRETVKRCDLAGWAEYGYCASHSRSFWGLRLHLMCTLRGLPVAFALTGAKADERTTLLDILATETDLVAARPGQTLIGAVETVARLHHTVRGRRLDHAHKTALDLVREHDVNAQEDLRIRSMVKASVSRPDPKRTGVFLSNGAAAKAGLNRSINDAGWGVFLAILRAKAEASAGGGVTSSHEYTSANQLVRTRFLIRRSPDQPLE
ncbi:transposase [Kitasatospora sp. NPDC093102]|uniref:transposase n=1 Tax=Kitasatospora sp. NPDC093102 TaxID=3155069 RepID=UPI0034185F94